MNSDKIDVAVNIFAKPWRTSLAILSLLKQSGQHIGKLWLQFEPAGIKYDEISPYSIYEYIKQKGLADCEASQPQEWLARQAMTAELLARPQKRAGVRYQHAFEQSGARLLFLMHNDVFILRDVLGAMRAQMGNAFAIGQIGQCWNCPAANAALMREVFDRSPCSPQTYADFQPTAAQLQTLYARAAEKGIFTRPYDLDGEFSVSPWPLPECRVNEWACLIDLQKTRPLTMPFGSAWPPGAYRACGEHNLDIAVPWFRDMHKHGLRARHFDISAQLKHWVGTGNNTPLRYVKAEDHARMLLKKHFPKYLEWLGQVPAPQV